MILHTCMYMKNEMTPPPRPHIATHTHAHTVPFYNDYYKHTTI